MKKILFLLLFPVMMFSQEISTTEDEYAYLTKGIRDQYTNGLDVKKDGYTMEKFFEKKSPNTHSIYTFYKFIDKSGNLKAISLILKTPNSKAGNGVYYCIPINNEKLFDKYEREVSSVTVRRNITYIVNEALFHLLNQKK